MKPIDRRSFLKCTSTAATVALAGPIADRVCAAEPRRERLVGIHIAAHSFYDEGFGHCLDLLQESAAVNALFVTSNSYYGAQLRPKEVQGNHGMPIRDGRGRRVTRRFFTPNAALYSGQSLRHRETKPDVEYAGKDVFSDLLGSARQRGMKVYERLYEPGSDGMLENIVGAEAVLTVNLHGQRGKRACWNHPDYLAFVEAWVRDLFRQHPLDGLQYGAERNGPLSRLIDWADEEPTCFCEHCRARAKRENVDFERAREGLTNLYDWVRAMQKGAPAPSDGAWVAFLRILMQYPEIFAWENMHYRAGEELHTRIYNAVKKERPTARVGRHLDHAQTSWDLFFRAAMPYERMVPCSDFLKLIVYHEIMGPRLRGRLDGYRRHYQRDLSPDQALQLFYAWAGHDAGVEPGLEQLAEKGLTPAYVGREVQRAFVGVGGRIPVYAGIAVDVPKGAGWGTQPSPSDPRQLEESLRCSFEAGAAGIVISREYEEMSLPSLRVIGAWIRNQRA